MRIVINLSEETNVCDVMVVERPIDRSIARRKPVNRLGQCLYFWFCSSLRWCSPRLSYAGRRAESLLAQPPVNQTHHVLYPAVLSIIKRTCQINITHMQYSCFCFQLFSNVRLNKTFPNAFCVFPFVKYLFLTT